MQTDAEARAWLVPLSGPPLQPLEVSTEAGTGVVLGRGEGCGLRLPVDAEAVSRRHARLTHHSGTGQDSRWRLADLGSSWGTYLNGLQLEPHRDMPLGEGDLVRIGPWTFHFSTRGVPHRGLVSEDDAAANMTLVRAHPMPADGRPATPPPMAENLLALLLESAAAVHAAASETELAEALIDAAVRGTGLPNAAVLRPLDAAGHLDVVAARRLRSGTSPEAPFTFSRSLITTASHGNVAELTVDGGGGNVAQSIVQMGICSALCVPLMLGGTVAAYLYLDCRTGSGRNVSPRSGSAAFCLALGRMAGLALANLKRAEVERRQALLVHDLSAAAVAQRWILPQRASRLGRFAVVGESRPGEYVGGDFFDLVPLDEHRVAVSLGDVSGHGVAASVLMTTAQGFLHAALSQGRPVDRAVTELNKFIGPRRPANRFLTLWVGVFDSLNRQVTYVNAGHGYAALIGADGSFTMLDGGDDSPVGFIDDAAYGSVTATLPPTGRAIILSDGIVEQFDATGDVSRQFGLARVQSALQEGDDAPERSDGVAALFDAVVRHAGSAHLQDDATAVMVTW